MNKSSNHPKEPWLAVVLSSFIAGIGQIYAGRKWRGSILIFTSTALIFLSIWSVLNPNCDILITAGVCVTILIVWIWNLFDAHKCTRKTNSDNFEAERKQGKDAWLALFLSDLIPGLGQIYIKRRLLGIGFMIIAGIILVVKGNMVLSGKYTWLHVSLWAFYSTFVCYHAYISAPIKRESSKKAISIIITVTLCSYLFEGFNPYVFRAYAVEAFILPTKSMKPTFLPGDRFLVKKSMKYIPERGDVIVFKSLDDPDIPYAKRIAALPGETLEIKNEILYIDGQKIRHPALQNIKYPPIDYIGMVGQPYTVPENHIFVIGDNSANSHDSRDFGTIPLNDVIGKAYKIYWPLNRRGPIE
jgi:signal peptidase I